LAARLAVLTYFAGAMSPVKTHISMKPTPSDGSNPDTSTLVLKQKSKFGQLPITATLKG